MAPQRIRCERKIDAFHNSVKDGSWQQWHSQNFVSGGSKVHGYGTEDPQWNPIVNPIGKVLDEVSHRLTTYDHIAPKEVTD